MKESIKIPREQKAIIAAALKVYQKAIATIINKEAGGACRPLDVDSLDYQHFDCRSLIAFFEDAEIDVVVELEESVKETFVHRGHGVDFPEYS